MTQTATNTCANLRISEDLEIIKPFSSMLHLQDLLQEHLLGTNAFDPTRPVTAIAQKIVYWNYCLREELTEVHEWLPFSHEKNLIEAQFELVDAYHFLNNIALEVNLYSL